MITIPVHTAIVLRGTNIPPQNVEALMQYARQCGFEVAVSTEPMGDIVDLEEHLRADLERLELLNYGNRSCLEPYRGLSLYSMLSLTLEDFIMRRQHRPYASTTHSCVCFDLQSAVLRLLMDRQLRFTDHDPAAFFTTPIADSQLPARTLNALGIAGIKWLEQCWYLTHSDILAMRNAGAKALDAIETRLGAKLPLNWE